ncbi:carboxylesterase/lipase family protein [Bacillus sp. FJAT-45350]|uniref:carboxylesterase/lipase family protein n=1 Tax=Bacillus sp. FJAT-45350 TaxID=2011014 RepID=UPI0015C79CD9|nr:carboxylesterase/lipase family protein [Bacillus sp. FJAT-45350]
MSKILNKIILTKYGKLEGVELERGIAWRGIPYARPPINELRWKCPQPPVAWTGVRDATRFSPRAIQLPAPVRNFVPTFTGDDPTNLSEDCLYLNVCTPKESMESKKSLKPVLLWFHGGGFHYGSGPNMIGDGEIFAQKGIVVVTFNYRLGAFGFLNLKDILGKQYSSSANCGIYDQIAALKWINENIEDFGGDPNNVTIAGVSAGAKSVINLISSPLAKGLFTRAISQSGGEHVIDIDEGELLTKKFISVLEEKGINTENLLEISPQDILHAQRQLGEGVRATWIWRPTIDGNVLTHPPVKALNNGAGKDIPLLIGFNCNEAISFDLPDPTATEQVFSILESIYGKGRASEIIELYAKNRPGATMRKVLQDIMTDERYRIPTVRIADAQSKHAQVWMYRFDGPTPGWDPTSYGGHGAECPLVWNIGINKEDYEISNFANQIQEAWAAFIHGEKPNSQGLPFWNQYELTKRLTMILDVTSKIENDPNGLERELWEGLYWNSGTWWSL